MKNPLFLFIVCFFSVLFSAQEININQGSIAQEKYFQTIKYEKKKGKLIVDVKIEGEKYKFLFDTGATFALTEKLQKKLNLPISGEVNTLDANNKVGEVKFSTVARLDLGGIEFVDTQGLILNESASKAFDCAGLDGIIGSNMLRNSIVRLDNSNNTIIITNDISTIHSPNDLYQDLVFLDEQSSPYVYSTLVKGNNDIGDYVLFDTGDDSFYELSLKTFDWIQTKNFDVFDIIAEGMGSFSYSMNGAANNTKLFVVKIPKLMLGSDVLLDVKSITTEGTISRFGSGFLKYGTVTLDYKNKRFYFEPYKEILAIEEEVRSFSPTFKDGNFVVGIVWDKDLKYIVNVGDQIIKVDDLDYSQLTFCDAISLDEESLVKINSVVVLKDINTNKLKTIKVKDIQ